MSRFNNYIITLFLICISTFGLFQIKFKVQNLHREVAELKKQLAHEKNSIHILKAEWAYLNQPERLQKFAEKFLNLSEVKPDQIIIPQTGSIIIAQNKQAYKEEALDNSPFIKTSMGSIHGISKPLKIKWRYKDRPDLTARRKK
jgi:cell division protein FtsL